MAKKKENKPAHYHTNTRRCARVTLLILIHYLGSMRKPRSVCGLLAIPVANPVSARGHIEVTLFDDNGV